MEHTFFCELKDTNSKIMTELDELLTISHSTVIKAISMKKKKNYFQ